MAEEFVKKTKEQFDKKIEKQYKEYLESKLDLIFGIDENEKDYYSMIRNGIKYNFIDEEGNLISDTWYDEVRDFSEGFARVEKDGKWNFIDKEGNLISAEWYYLVFDFSEGFAPVYKAGKYNFIDKEGNLISEEWYDGVNYFSEGYAAVKKAGKWNFIDRQGNLISAKWYDRVDDFSKGYAIVIKDGKWNFIDEDGNLISEEWYDGEFSFSKKGYAIVIKDGKENFIDKEGNLISEEWYDYVDDFFEGYAKVKKDGKYNFIDEDGNLISDTWYDDVMSFSGGHAAVKKDGKWYFIDRKGIFIYKKWYNDVMSYSEDYAIVANNSKYSYILFNDSMRCSNMVEYKVKKVGFSYLCYNPDYKKDKFLLKYQPIKMYGLRYVFCIDQKKENWFIYDRKNNSYQNLGYIISRIDNHLIITSDKVYLMYEDKMLDITDYYNEHLKGKNININSGVSIIDKGEFYVKNSDEIKELLKEEERKNIEEQRRIEKEKEEKELQRKFKEAKENEERAKKEIAKKREKALKAIARALEILQETDDKVSNTRIKLNDIHSLFVEVGDHKEINSIFINNLRYIDLSGVIFKDVKMSGIDFRGCNIWLNPQDAYQKDLRGCNFEGLYIDVFTNFTGVDIRGAKFSADDDPRTIDGQNMTFQNAIYDETTTYNGIPFTEIYKKLN